MQSRSGREGKKEWGTGHCLPSLHGQLPLGGVSVKHPSGVVLSAQLCLISPIVVRRENDISPLKTELPSVVFFVICCVYMRDRDREREKERDGEREGETERYRETEESENHT